MLKYDEYLFEQNRVLKKGDICTFKSSDSRPYFRKYDGECEIIHVYPNSNYTVKCDKGTFLAQVVELTLKKEAGSQEPKKKEANPAGYIDNQFQETSSEPGKTNVEIVPGTRVAVNGNEGRVVYDGDKGTVKKVNATAYLIDFDENDAKNQRAYSSLVKKDIVTAIDEPSVPIFKTGDKVLCVDKSSQFFNQEGEVERIWEDGQCMVLFNVSGGIQGTPMKPHQIKIVEYVKPKSGAFKKDIPVASSGPVGQEPEEVKITSEEEEDDEEEVSITSAPFKKADLLEFSYTDFLMEEKLTTVEATLANKTKYEEVLKSPEIQEFKKIFVERSLRTAEIIESYFNFLINKISGGLPVFRTLEQIDNEDLLKTKTKVRASDSKELTRKYSFDQGIIAYWKFKDAIIFKTI